MVWWNTKLDFLVINLDFLVINFNTFKTGFMEYWFRSSIINCTSYFWVRFSGYTNAYDQHCWKYEKSVSQGITNASAHRLIGIGIKWIWIDWNWLSILTVGRKVNLIQPIANNAKTKEAFQRQEFQQLRQHGMMI